SGVNLIARMPKLNQTSIDYNDQFFRLRLQSLQAVDEMVERVVLELESLGIADNTYIIYTTDNGYHIGQHRLQPGNMCGFETDINVPLLIRGPGVPKSKVTDAVTSHTDLAPTILLMAGITKRPDFDGLSVPLSRNEIEQGARASAEHVGIEYWGILADESWLSDRDLGNVSFGNTYKGIRIQSKAYNLYYAVHCTNEHELYDMTVDPYQINNLLPSSSNGTGMPIETYAQSQVQVEGRSLLAVVSRLDAIMGVMKSCKGKTCTNPWEVLHPKGDVKNLRDALKTRFDAFYLESAKGNSVSFSMCAGGYLASVESSQQPSIYARDGDWSILT
ncbi:alkaline phosphatase-like protein, partial [Cadophora sp. DSE1049]